MSNQKTIAYCGSIWGNNVGDRAIYEANRKLFSDYELIPGRHADSSLITLLGGGTILPRAIQPEWEIYDAISRDFNYTMGVGVRDPDFWNRPRCDYDIRYWAGRLGINILKISRENKPFGYIIRKIEKQLGKDVDISGYYCHKKGFELISQFNFDRISVRGPLSQQILKRHGIESRVIGDPALILEPNEYSNNKTNEIIISLKGETGDKWVSSNDYIAELISFCNNELQNYNIVFMAFDPKDIPISLFASSKISNSKVRITHHLQFDDILDEIASADVMIGERLHASILASSCYVPFISLGYRPKNEDFAKSINMARQNIQINKLSEQKLKQKFNNTLNNYNTIMRNMEENVSAKRNSLQDFTELIVSDIQNV